jgi:hypothetical protein
LLPRQVLPPKDGPQRASSETSCVAEGFEDEVRVVVDMVRNPVEDERVEDEVGLDEDADLGGMTTALHVPNLD